jgi:hypothetical protein
VRHEENKNAVVAFACNTFNFFFFSFSPGCFKAETKRPSFACENDRNPCVSQSLSDWKEKLCERKDNNKLKVKQKARANNEPV